MIIIRKETVYAFIYHAFVVVLSTIWRTYSRFSLGLPFYFAIRVASAKANGKMQKV